jgi:predicted dehydrogenase
MRRQAERSNAGTRGTVLGVLLLGAGDRGQTYARWIKRHPDRLRLLAIAEPRPAPRNRLAAEHGLPPHACFADWREALDAGVGADGIIIALQDQLHREATTRSLSTGAHVLLEKPIAVTRDDVLAIAAAADEAAANGGSLTVCHVLRYSSLFGAVKRVIDHGLIGTVQSIFLAENVSYYHFAHSFVRGNWRRSDESSPLILAKSCHDLDILCWLADAAPEWVASTAGRGFFTEDNAPDDAPNRCTDGCPVAAGCAYEAVSTYLRGVPLKTVVGRTRGPLAAAARFSLRHPRVAARLPFLSHYAVWTEWPTRIITDDLTESGIRHALETGPYGRCVFRCDNDQPDHQDTVIRFANGITAGFRLHGRSFEEGRTLRIDGSTGTLRAKFGGGTELTVHPHGALKGTSVPVAGDVAGHREADAGLMDAWSRVFDGAHAATDARTSVASHLLAFAADESARSGNAMTL